MNYKNFDDYQKECAKTAIFSKGRDKYLIPTLGIAGEAGEVADKIKKVIRDNNGKFTKESTNEIAKELGDILWYVSMLSLNLGINLSDVVKMNLEKISYRSKENKIHGSGDNR